MAKFVILFFLFISLSSSHGKNFTSKTTPRKSPRKYYDEFKDFRTYYKSDDNVKLDKPNFTHVGSTEDFNEPEIKPYVPYENFKRNEKKNYYNPSTYPSTWKGTSFLNSNQVINKVNPDEMMAMMNTLKMMQNSKESNIGFFGKLLSDPKSILIVTFLPVSIILASFIPLLMNYFMSKATLPTVLSTVANSKLGRSLNNAEVFDSILRNIEKYRENLLQSDGCIEDIVCNFVVDNLDDDNDTYYFTKATNIVTNLIKKEWLQHSRISNVLSGIKQRNCLNMCS